MSTYTRWYREGTVAATNGSNVIVGTNTYWDTAGFNPGDILKLSGVDYEILEVTDATHLKIAGTYSGATTTGSSYAVVRNFTATTQAKVAAQTSELLLDFSKYIDNDMQSIHGKSAYEVAVKGGYSGTEAEWLESLIGAGQWTTLNTRTAMIPDVLHSGLSHNAIYRGKNLGAHPTAAQYKSIREGTFDDMYIGDYWSNGGWNFMIAHFDYYRPQWIGGIDPETGENGETDIGWGKHHVVVYCNQGVAGAYYVWGSMNSDGTWPGYTGSNWYVNLRPQYVKKFANTFGTEHMWKWVNAVPTLYNSDGSVASYEIQLQQCEVIRMEHVMGQNPRNLKVSHDNGKMALFLLNQHAEAGTQQLFDIDGGNGFLWTWAHLGDQWFRDAALDSNGGRTMPAYAVIGSAEEALDSVQTYPG